MAVGDTEQLQAAVPTPALGLQLLAGVHSETALALVRPRPAVAAGPEMLEPPAAIGLPRAQQQGASLLGCHDLQPAPQQDQQALIDSQDGWRGDGHTDTL
jgi:hypothetical protein